MKLFGGEGRELCDPWTLNDSPLSLEPLFLHFFHISGHLFFLGALPCGVRNSVNLARNARKLSAIGGSHFEARGRLHRRGLNSFNRKQICETVASKAQLGYVGRMIWRGRGDGEQAHQSG